MNEYGIVEVVMTLAHHEHITHVIEHTGRKRSAFEVIVLINDQQ